MNTYHNLLAALTKLYGKEAAEYAMRDKSPEDENPYWSTVKMQKDCEDFLSKREGNSIPS